MQGGGMRRSGVCLLKKMSLDDNVGAVELC